VAKCLVDECPLKGKRVVPYAGNRRGKLVFFGESPGNKEVLNGVPFYHQAPAGKMARDLVAQAGLEWRDIFLMNSARCMIAKDELSTKDIAKTLAACRVHVVAALKQLKPKIIIAAGDFALRQLLRRSGIKKARGTLYWSEEFECWVMPTYHPAYVCRTPANAKLVIEDLKMVASVLKNGGNPMESKAEKKYIETQSILALLDKAEDVEFTIGIDSETQGIDWMDPNFLLISYSISFKPLTGINVTLFEECGPNEAEFSITWPRPDPESKKREKVPTDVFLRRAQNFEQKLDELEALLTSKRIKKYLTTDMEFHAFRWLFRRFRDKVVKIERVVMDIQAAANLIDENIYQLADLGTMQKMFTDDKVDYKREFESRYDKADMLNVAYMHPTAFRQYACQDADTTRQVGLSMKEYFAGHPKLLNYLVRFTMPTLDTLSMMEETGACINLEELPKVKNDVFRLLAEEEQKATRLLPAPIRERHDGKLSLTRDALIRDALFDEDGFGFDVIKRTKTKEPSCDKEVRALLLDRPIRKKAREFILSYNQWSEYQTLYTRYLKGFEKHVKHDGRIHTSYSLATTVTGRTATSSPNMQNNPKRSKSAHLIRRLICAPPGYVLLAIDQGQAELRWAAHLSGDPEMIRIFKSGGLDIHTETAKSLYPGRWEELDEKGISTQRRNAKAVNFGLLYLMGLEGFIKYAKIEYGIDLGREQGQTWIDIFFSKYKMLPVYHRKMIEFGRRNGFVESVLGRRRRLPNLHSEDRVLKNEAERMAVNHPIQEPSSSTCLLAANEMREQQVLSNLDEIRLSLFVHDELIFEVREDKVDEYAPIIKWHMENPPLERDFGVKLKVPLVAEPKVGPNMAEMKALDLTA